jgi:hypothetical protein
MFFNIWRKMLPKQLANGMINLLEMRKPDNKIRIYANLLRFRLHMDTFEGRKIGPIPFSTF